MAGAGRRARPLRPRARSTGGRARAAPGVPPRHGPLRRRPGGGSAGAGGRGRRSRAQRPADRLPPTGHPAEGRGPARRSPAAALPPAQWRGGPGGGRGWAPHLYFLADAGRHGAGRSARVPLEALLRTSAASPHHGALRRPPRPRPARCRARRPLPAPGASILKNRAVTRPAPPQVGAASDASASRMSSRGADGRPGGTRMRRAARTRFRGSRWGACAVGGGGAVGGLEPVRARS